MQSQLEEEEFLIHDGEKQESLHKPSGTLYSSTNSTLFSMWRVVTLGKQELPLVILGTSK